MGFARLLNRAASSPNQQNVAPGRYSGGPTQFMAGPEQRWPSTATLPPPTEVEALGVPAFWKCHAYVTGTVGMLPAVAYRGTDAVDPQPPVIVQPDPAQTPMAFWAGMASSLALYGNAISIITSTDRLGWPATLKPIHPTLAAVRFTGNPMAPDIAAWYLAGQLYDPSEVWHVKSHLGRPGWPLGRGLLDVDGDAIAIELALQTYAASYFNSGGTPSGILKIHRPEITQDQADSAKQAWIAKYSGAPTVAVLNELTDFTPVAFKPVDSQMIESRQMGLVDIANMWQVPPSKVGASVGGGTYRNAEMEEVQARNDAVAQWTTLLEGAASIELLPRGQRLLWDLGASLRTDTLSEYQAEQFALGGPGPQSQWKLVDEVRARHNMDPISIVAKELGVAVPPGIEEEPDPPVPPPIPVLPAQPVRPAIQGDTAGGNPTALPPGKEGT
jgi:HK97 family phage portal protein